MILRPRLGQDLLAELDVGAFEADDQRHRDGHFLGRRDHAFGDDVAAHDAAEDVDQDALHGGSERMILNAACTFSFDAPPPTSRKFAGSAP